MDWIFFMVVQRRYLFGNDLRTVVLEMNLSRHCFRCPLGILEPSVRFSNSSTFD